MLSSFVNPFFDELEYFSRTSQRIINETVTKKNLELESQIEKLTRGQAGLKKKVEEIRTTLFSKSFEDLVKSSIETINEIEKKTKTKKKEDSEES